MRIKPMLACMTIVCLLTMSATVAADKWLHVHVEEAGGETVNVNIPLSIVESMLPHIAVDELQNGKLQIDAGHDLAQRGHRPSVPPPIERKSERRIASVGPCTDNARCA